MKISLKDLGTLRDSHPGRRIAFLSGTFDLLHAGHVNYLNKAREIAGDHILVVGVNSDDRTRRVKGKHRPVIPQADRVNMVANLKSVDYAFVMPRNSVRNLRPSFQVIKELRPDLFIAPDDGWLEGIEYYKRFSTEIVVFKRIDKTSTSRIIKRIQSFREP